MAVLKKLIIKTLFVILATSLLSIGKVDPPLPTLEDFIVADLDNGPNSSTWAIDRFVVVKKYEELIHRLEEKSVRFKSDRRYVGWIFSKIHQDILVKYDPFSKISGTLTNGSYDCVSASALFALVLTDLGYEVTIVETNYHIYLEVQLGDRMIMLETTDAIDGFIEGRNIQVRKDQIVANNLNETELIASSFDIEKNINLRQLLGLAYYNQAVKSYQDYALVDALYYCEIGLSHYDSDRISLLKDQITRSMIEESQSIGRTR